MLKFYIAVLDTVDSGHQILSVAHGTLMAHLKFKDVPEYKEWISNSFRKCIIKVNQKEFNKIKEDIPEITIVTEGALDNQEIAIAICPREDYPNVIKFAKLFKYE